MAQGMRNGGTDRARRALESCIARLRRGDTIAQALADCSHETDDLRTLLSTFDLVRQAAVAPPAPPRGLAEGRDRFLAAAAVLRNGADAPVGAGIAAAEDALDQALSGAFGRTSVDGPNARPTSDGAIDELVDVAAAVRRAVAPVPALNGALTSGKARFMAAADVLRSARSDQADVAAEGVDAEALDAALASVASGADLRAAVADSGATAPHTLADLLAVARDLGATAPAPATAHRAGRAGFLAAAHGLAIATGRQPAEAAVDADQLDSAIARFMAGDPVSAIVADVSGATATALAGLLGTVECLTATAPAPCADLGTGRARLLDVADGVRHLRAPERAGATVGTAVAAGLGDWIANLTRSFRPHVAAMAAAITLALFAGNALLVPVSAGARPGDGLLYQHKLLMQELRLAVATVNPGWRDDVRAEISRERLADIADAKGEAVEVSVDGRLRGYEDLTQPGEKGHGLIHMVALGEGGNDKGLTAAWRAGETRFALPIGYASLGDVPAGTSMRLKIRTGSEPPLAMKVALLGLDPLVPLTATLTATATATITPTGMPASATPTPTDSVATSTPTVTPDATSTPMASPTVTPTLTATVPVVPNPVEARHVPRGQELEGQVLRIGDTDWTVRRAADKRNGDLEAGAVDVQVSVTGLTNAQSMPSILVGDRVRLRGAYVDGRRDRFTAIKLIGYMPKDEGCKDRGAVLGIVARYQPGDDLALQDGTTFEIDPTAPPSIDGVIEVGSTVVVDHQECGGRLVARGITVTDGRGQATPESQEYNGVVRELIDGRTMALEMAGTRYIVRFDPGTVSYQGAPVAIAVGQRVSVWGRLVAPGAGVIEAERIDVLRLATPPTLDVPTATATSAPSATPQPSPTSTTTAIDDRPELLPPGLPAPPEPSFDR